MAAQTAFLEADALGLTFASGLIALDRVSFKIAPGEFVAVVGPSGCGKSTLLRILAGLLQPTTGSLRATTADAVHHSQSPDRVGIVFQEPTLLPWRTAVANVALPLELGKVRGHETRRQAVQALANVGLADFRQHFPHELSGGMRMRCSLARALVTSPSLLLLDEPFAALDDISRQQLNEDLRGLWLAQRFTAVFVTHNIAEAAFLSGRILVMSPRPGRIVEEFEVPFAAVRDPLLRAEPEFARFTGAVSAVLRRAAA